MQTRAVIHSFAYSPTGNQQLLPIQMNIKFRIYCLISFVPAFCICFSETYLVLFSISSFSLFIIRFYRQYHRIVHVKYTICASNVGNATKAIDRSSVKFIYSYNEKIWATNQRICCSIKIIWRRSVCAASN